MTSHFAFREWVEAHTHLPLDVLFIDVAPRVSFNQTECSTVIHCFSPLSFACLYGMIDDILLLLVHGASKTFPLPYVSESSHTGAKEYVCRCVSPLEAAYFSDELENIYAVWEKNALPDYYVISNIHPHQLPPALQDGSKRSDMRQMNKCIRHECLRRMIQDDRDRVARILHPILSEHVDWFVWDPVVFTLILEYELVDMDAVITHHNKIKPTTFDFNYLAYLNAAYQLYLHPKRLKSRSITVGTLARNTIWGDGTNLTDMRAVWKQDRTNYKSFLCLSTMASVRTIPRLGHDSPLKNLPTDMLRLLRTFLLPLHLSLSLTTYILYLQEIRDGELEVSFLEKFLYTKKAYPHLT